MKIGIFDPYLDTLGGGEKYMLTAALCLAKKHEVEIFWDSEIEEIKKTAKKRFNLDLDNLKFKKNIFSSQTSLLERLLQTKKYDAIIFLSDGSLPFTKARKLIIHFQFPVEWVNGISIANKLKLRRARVICNSNFTKKYVDRKFGIKSKIIYPPVDIEEEHGVKKENVILNVGRFGKNVEGALFKKQDVLIDVFKKMLKKGLKNWKLILVIATRIEDKNRLMKLKKAAKGLPIEFIENPNKNSLSKIYAKSKIYWHASGFGEDLAKHPERAEHFGIATVEAMACGAVPIVINAGGQREIVQENENGLLWETRQELQDKTLWVIKDENVWQRLSESAKLTSKTYSRERFCKEINEVIEK